LGCWCAPEPCHGDVLVGLIEEIKRCGNVHDIDVVTEASEKRKLETGESSGAIREAQISKKKKKVASKKRKLETGESSGAVWEAQIPKKNKKMASEKRKLETGESWGAVLEAQIPKKKKKVASAAGLLAVPVLLWPGDTAGHRVRQPEG